MGHVWGLLYLGTSSSSFPKSQGSKPVYLVFYSIEASPSSHSQNECCCPSKTKHTALIYPEASASLETPSEYHLFLDQINVFTKHKIMVKRVEWGKERRNMLKNTLEQHPTVYFSKARKRRELGGE